MKRYLEFKEEKEKVRKQYYSHVEDNWVLEILAIHPNAQRKGIGHKLMDWGIKQADEFGEEVFLEATEVGVGLYKKYGFDEITVLSIGSEEREGGKVEFVIMIRKPNPTTEKP